jgi:hypothetical protein
LRLRAVLDDAGLALRLTSHAAVALNAVGALIAGMTRMTRLTEVDDARPDTGTARAFVALRTGDLVDLFVQRRDRRMQFRDADIQFFFFGLFGIVGHTFSFGSCHRQGHSNVQVWMGMRRPHAIPFQALRRK